MLNYNFFTYILTNHNRTILYTGVTNDLSRRLYEHFTRSDKLNSFTYKYSCFYLVWFERHQHIQHAIEREKEIKGWTRIKKVALIEGEDSDWKFLNGEIMEWPPRLHGE